MTCPDWDRLVALRDGVAPDRFPSSTRRKRSKSQPPAAAKPVRPEAGFDTDWLSALEHLDSCPHCVPAALAADPTLVFRRLAPLELSPAEEAAEVESVRRAVAAMRTGRRYELDAQAVARRRHWHRYAAAALLAAGALALGVDRRVDVAGATATPHRAAVSRAGAPGAFGGGGGGESPRAFGPTPVASGAILPASAVTLAAPGSFALGAATADGSMEGLNRPHARVYQLHGRHLQVVMIVDEKLDV